MPSSGYFVAHGGDADTALRGVLTDYALKVEMHESMSDGGKLTMKPLDSVPNQAKSTVAFAPGDKHLMPRGVNAPSTGREQLKQTFPLATSHESAERQAG